MKNVRLQKGLGVLYILGAALCFALMNLFVRTAGDLPLMQKVFFRNLFAMVIVFFALLRDKKKFRIQKGALPFLLLRSAVGFLGVILNFYAIDRLNISDASILNKLSPFFAILFSVFMLKEKPTPVELLFVAVTFGGAMFVVKPTFSWEVLPALSGLLSGMCAGFAYTCVRILGKKNERGIMTVFFFSAFSTVLSLPFMIATYQSMSFPQFASLLLAGLSATGGQFFITAAYRKAPAKELAVFDYSQVLFAALLGFFFLDQIPDYLSIIGYVIIIGTAVLKWLYTKRRTDRKQQGEASAVPTAEETFASDEASVSDGDLSVPPDEPPTPDRLPTPEGGFSVLPDEPLTPDRLPTPDGGFSVLSEVADKPNDDRNQKNTAENDHTVSD